MSKARRTPARTEPKSQFKPEAKSVASRSYLDVAIPLGLILATLIVYAQTAHFDFVTYDDDLYVENAHVQAGLTFESIKWALTAIVSNNWTPVTLLSHVVAGQLFHLDAGSDHMVNVILHALAAVLLFAVLRRATGARAPGAFVALAPGAFVSAPRALVARAPGAFVSVPGAFVARAPGAFVALMFAVHPLHVASVAWISERKDVLSACFFFLALDAYVRYVERPVPRRYLLMAGMFCLGLMAKPMLVTFPFVLLLLDVWPLNRPRTVKLIWEKLPLLALAAIASAVTYFAQSLTGAVVHVPFIVRIENALVSYVTYIGQMFWPAGFSVIYPYPPSIPLGSVAIALVLLAAITGLAWATRRTHPYIAVGWFWYLGMLVPVIGVVQVGLQSHADRYTYLPMVGLLIILAWGAAEALAKWPRMEPAVVTAAVLCCVISMAIAWTQVAYWQNSETLYQRAIDVTQSNWLAEYNLGQYLMHIEGRNGDALPHLEEAVRIKPDYPEARNNLGASLINAGHYADAIPQFEAALKSKPEFPDALFNYALALSKIPGRSADAIAQYQAVLRLDPKLEKAHTNLGVLLVNQGRTEEAIPHFEAAVRLNPDFQNEHNLGAILTTIPGRQAEALVHLEAAQRIKPDDQTSQIIERLRAGMK